ncbi:MAG: acyltransferase [Candidatus Sericytochromatia bacterium]|nr:acyltransferase [Candidatus Sericytochromatia bacterium]
MQVERQNNFDALRIFAALMVLYGHSFALAGELSPGLMGNSVQALGVKVFFAISGFLIAGSWKRDSNPLRFFWRRSLRIFPALWIVVLASTFLLGPMFTSLDFSSYFSSDLIVSYLMNAIFVISFSLPGVFEGNKYPLAVNGSLWSLPAEFAMYILTPFIVLLGKNRYFAISVASIVSIGGALVVSVPHGNSLVFWGNSLYSLAEVAPFFVSGAFIALGGFGRPNLQLGVALFAIIISIKFDVAAQQFFLGMILPYFVLSIALVDSPLFSGVSRYGDLSYGIYLYGFPVQQAVSHIFGEDVRQWHLFWIACPVVFFLSLASWHFIEKRALKLKDFNSVSVFGFSR